MRKDKNNKDQKDVLLTRCIICFEMNGPNRIMPYYDSYPALLYGQRFSQSGKLIEVIDRVQLCRFHYSQMTGLSLESS